MKRKFTFLLVLMLAGSLISGSWNNAASLDIDKSVETSNHTSILSGNVISTILCNEYKPEVEYVSEAITNVRWNTHQSYTLVVDKCDIIRQTAVIQLAILQELYQMLPEGSESKATLLEILRQKRIFYLEKLRECGEG